MNLHGAIKDLEWLADQQCVCAVILDGSHYQCTVCRARNALQHLEKSAKQQLTQLSKEHEHEGSRI